MVLPEVAYRLLRRDAHSASAGWDHRSSKFCGSTEAAREGTLERRGDATPSLPGSPVATVRRKSGRLRRCRRALGAAGGNLDSCAPISGG